MCWLIAPRLSISEFDMEKFKEELKKHEGVVYKIYPDPIHGAAAPTLGVGHLVVLGDKHYGQPIGTPVSREEVEEYLANDAQIAVDESKKLYRGFDDLPLEVQYIISNMMFNLGYTR